MPTKVSTQKWIQYDHYVAYKNRVIENMYIGNLNHIFHDSIMVAKFNKEEKEIIRMKEMLAQYKDALQIINVVVKIRREDPDTIFSNVTELRYVVN